MCVCVCGGVREEGDKGLGKMWCKVSATLIYSLWDNVCVCVGGGEVREEGDKGLGRMWCKVSATLIYSLWDNVCMCVWGGGRR